jgi:hypothetical protein
VEDYTYITDNLYTKQQVAFILIIFSHFLVNFGDLEWRRNISAFYALQVVKMESDILNLLKFEMGSPTARTFLRYLLFLKLFQIVIMSQSHTPVVL